MALLVGIHPGQVGIHCCYGSYTRKRPRHPIPGEGAKLVADVEAHVIALWKNYQF
jgi:hypothetical protein